MEEAEKTVELEVDELFVGLTRPATVLGVHFTAFVVEMIVVGCVFLAIGTRIPDFLPESAHRLGCCRVFGWWRTGNQYG